MDPAPVLIVAHHSTHHLAHRCRDTHPRRPSLSPKYLTRAQMPSQITTVLLRRRPTRMRIVARRGAARFFVSGRELRLVVSTAGWLDGHTRVHEYRVSHDEIDHGGRSRRHSDSTLIPKEGKWLLLLRRLRPRRLRPRRLLPRSSSYFVPSFEGRERRGPLAPAFCYSCPRMTRSIGSSRSKRQGEFANSMRVKPWRSASARWRAAELRPN